MTLPIYLVVRRHSRKYEAQVIQAYEAGTIKAFVKNHNKSIVALELTKYIVIPPLAEEVLFRGPVALLAQYHLNSLIVWAVGLALCVEFARRHNGELGESPQSVRLYRGMAFAMGATAVLLVTITGLLASAIVFHFFVKPLRRQKPNPETHRVALVYQAHKNSPQRPSPIDRLGRGLNPGSWTTIHEPVSLFLYRLLHMSAETHYHRSRVIPHHDRL